MVEQVRLQDARDVGLVSGQKRKAVAEGVVGPAVEVEVADEAERGRVRAAEHEGFLQSQADRLLVKERLAGRGVGEDVVVVAREDGEVVELPDRVNEAGPEVEAVEAEAAEIRVAVELFEGRDFAVKAPGDAGHPRRAELHRREPVGLRVVVAEVGVGREELAGVGEKGERLVFFLRHEQALFAEVGVGRAGRGELGIGGEDLPRDGAHHVAARHIGLGGGHLGGRLSGVLRPRCRG